MPKSLKSIGLISVFLILSSTALFATEQITITTYYPSPYGVYRELRSQRMAIGETYIKHDTVCWEGAPINCDGFGGQTMIPTGSFDPDTDLIVEGRVGIGTTRPQWGKVQIESINVPLAFRETDQTGAGSLWRMPLDSKSLRFDSSDDGIDFGPPFTTPFRLFSNGGISVGTVYSGGVPPPANGAIIQGNVGIGTTSPGATLEVKGTMKVFGAWNNTFSYNTVYQAPTDGFVVYRYTGTASDPSLLQILSDGANPPTVARAYFRCDANVHNNPDQTIMAPVKKGDYWKATGGEAAGTKVVYWLPLGS